MLLEWKELTKDESNKACLEFLKVGSNNFEGNVNIDLLKHQTMIRNAFDSANSDQSEMDASRRPSISSGHPKLILGLNLGWDEPAARKRKLRPIGEIELMSH